MTKDNQLLVVFFGYWPFMASFSFKILILFILFSFLWLMQNDSQQKHTFKKSERLCNRDKIKALFEKANAINAYPIKLLYKKEEGEGGGVPMKLVISVPKRNIKKAVRRNKIKRRMREAYRLNRHLLLSPVLEKPINCNAILLYSAKEELTFNQIESKIIHLLNRLNQEYEKTL